MSRSVVGLNDRLKQMYMKIHPDRFHRHPDALQTNSKSLALFNSFISTVKTGRVLQTNSFVFQFFLPSEPQQQAISVQFQLSSSDTRDPRVKRQIQTVLQELLYKCKVPHDFVWEDFFMYDASSSSSLSSNDSSFSSAAASSDVRADFESGFYKTKRAVASGQIRANMMDRLEFMEFVKQCHLDSMHLRLQEKPEYILVRRMIASLRLSGFRIIFETNVESLGIDIQKQVLEQFHTIMLPDERVQKIKDKAIFVIGAEPTHLDPAGRFYLNVHDSSDSWIKLIESNTLESEIFDVGETSILATDREMFEGRKTLERKVSSALGINDIFPEEALMNVKRFPEYIVLLNDLKLASNQKDFTKFDGSDFLRLMVRNPGSEPQLRIDNEMGVILVPLGTSASQIISFLRTHSSDARNLHEQYVKAKKEYELKVELVKRKLRLRKFGRDEKVCSRKHMIQCANALLQLSASESARFHTMEVIVSDFYQFVPEQGMCGVMFIHQHWYK